MLKQENLPHLWELLNLFNQWEEIQEICERTIGSGIQIVGIESENVMGRQYNCLFCQYILDSKSGYQRCIESYQEGCFSKMALREGFSIFKCHAGLTIFALPLILHQKPIAAIVGGGIFAGNNMDEEGYKRFALEMNINPERLFESIDKVKKISSSELTILGRMLKLLIDPLKDEIIRYYSLIEQGENISNLIKESNDARIKRCVITGIGVVSPIGMGKEEFWQALCVGKSGVSQIELFDTSNLPVKIAGEIKDFKPQDHMDHKSTKRTDRATQFAIAAANLAVKDSQIDFEQENKERINVVIGAGVGGLAFAEKQVSEFLQFGPEKISPFLSIIAFSGSLSSMVSLDLGLKGASITVSTGCPAGTDAIGHGFRAIQNNEADVVIAGGAESPIRPVIITSFYAMNALSLRNDEPTKASRPFDANRDGFVLGEGSGIIILEELNHALNRNAHIYAEVVGYATTNDAYHMATPAPDGQSAARAFNLALNEAQIKPSEINYINPHGSSTPLGDKTETLVIKQVFGKDAYRIPISSTKSMLGHSIGATGAIELIVCSLTVENNFIPPTINYETRDTDCDLDYVPNIGRNAKIDAAFSNSFGFGGKNSALVIKRYKNDQD
ncbi:MAG: beta-ketoacyl-ACP synthase II [Candidatus Desantisbacteria bacterium]